ncbi:AAA family ATPase [Streptomyces smyrnaeus]|uniref:AAA family ATPase n=1 Tax=Streptomyces smyrnaeus TaxID=1387713 RepID=UPI0037BDF23E
MALLEREAELTAVEHTVTALCGTGAPDVDGGTAERAGGLLAFTGALGLGKTALLREIQARVSARGGTVLYACGGEQEQEVGFHLVRRLLRPLLPALDERRLRAELGSWYDLAAPAAGLPAPDPAVVPDPRGVRLALDRLFAHLAERHAPLAVLVDDVHWADPASLAWLTGFAPRVPELPLLCALGYDPREPRPDVAALHSALVNGRAEPPYGLSELSTDAVFELVRGTCAGETGTAFAQECRKLTGGNPRAVTELLHRARAAGFEPPPDSRPRPAELAPASPDGELLHRLEMLGPDCVRLSWAVAVLGADATLPFAARVAGLRAEAARGAADRLREARVLDAPGGVGDAPLTFRHPALAGEVYRAVPAGIRTAMHGQTAAALAATPGTPRGSSVRHLLEVHPDGDPVLVDELRRAAHEYTRAGAPDAAYRCLGRALREPPTRRERPDVLYELAAAAFRSGAPAATVHHLRAALEEPACDVEQRLRAVRLLVRALSRTGRPEEALRTLEAEVRCATDPTGREALRAELSLWRALHSAADDERPPPVPALRAWYALRHGEPADTVLRLAEDAVAAGLPWTDDPWGCEAPALVVRAFLHCGRPDRAEHLLRQGIAACERVGLHGEHLALARTLLDRP